MTGVGQIDSLLGNLRALGPRRLSLLGIVGAVVFASIGIGSYLVSRPDYETLYAGLVAQDVSRIGLVLREAGVAFDVSPEGSRILVRRGTAPEARMLLAERGLPSSATAGYELFDKLGPMGLTSFMQEVTRLRVLEGEIARTIQTMKGVKAARVHIAMPDGGALRRSRQPTAASVVIRADRGHESISSQAIRHLVASAVPGLTGDQVTVISADGGVLSSGENGANAAAGKMLELEKTVSGEIRDNVRRTLAPYLGMPNFEVSVTARLNIDRRQTNETSFDPDSKAERSLRVVKEQGASQNSQGRSRVTVEQNIPAEEGQPGSNDQSKRSNERREELTNYELSTRTIATISDGYRMESVTVALVINKKQLLANAGSAPSPDSVEMQVKEIERLVATSAGLDPRRGDKVSVTAVEFLAGQMDPLPSAGIAELLSQQVGTVAKAAAAVAAMFLLVWFGLRPLVQVLGASPPAPATPLVADAGAVGGLVAQDTGPMSTGFLSQMSDEPLTVQAQLEKAVADDEEQVSAILKQWLKEA